MEIGKRSQEEKREGKSHHYRSKSSDYVHRSDKKILSNEKEDQRNSEPSLTESQSFESEETLSSKYYTLEWVEEGKINYLKRKVNGGSSPRSLSPSKETENTKGKVIVAYATAVGGNPEEVGEINLSEKEEIIRLHSKKEEVPDFKGEGNITAKSFRKVKKLGQGHFGSVWLVSYKKSDQLFAVKTVKEGNAEMKRNDQVIKIWRSINHPFFVKL